jgi:DnaK suppressor protein
MTTDETFGRTAEKEQISGLSPFDWEDALPQGYRPVVDEPYMNPKQLAYFRMKLLLWKHQLEKEMEQKTLEYSEGNEKLPEPIDRGTREMHKTIILRLMERNRNLISQIEKALIRVENRTYGFCEETEEEIGIKRLEAFPAASLCLESQRLREFMVK